MSVLEREVNLPAFTSYAYALFVAMVGFLHSTNM